MRLLIAPLDSPSYTKVAEIPQLVWIVLLAIFSPESLEPVVGIEILPLFLLFNSSPRKWHLQKVLVSFGEIHTKAAGNIQDKKC